MEYRITINLDNDAFGATDHEIANELQRVLEKLQFQISGLANMGELAYFSPGVETSIADSSGNICLEAIVTGEEPEPTPDITDIAFDGDILDYL